MTKHTVEKLRINYASGKYDMLALLLAYQDIIKGEDLPDVIYYKVFPEVKSELAKRISEVPIAQKMYAEYQQELRLLVSKAETIELSGAKYYPYQDHSNELKEVFIKKLSTLETISYADIRGFYLEDAEEC